MKCLTICYFVVSMALSTLGHSQEFPAQHSHDVDVEMREYMSTGYFSTNASSTVRYNLGITNTHKHEVALLWLVTVPEGGYARTFPQAFGTSYKPLAAAFSAGLSQQLFVLGFVERTSELVIERWTLRGASVSVTLGPSEEKIVGFVQPNAVREELYRGPGHYVYGCVFHPQSRDLIYLREDPAALHTELMKFEVDVTGASPVSMLTVNDVPFLGDASGITIDVDSVTDDVYLFLWDHPAWMPQGPPVTSVPSSGPIGPSEYRAHLLMDGDADGLFEVSYEDDYSTIAELIHAMSWSRLYEAATP